MKLRSVINADSGLSVLLHVLKALVALFVNWIVLQYFAVDDFVVWSVTSSILIVASASDLGIGQYAVTRLINDERTNWPRHVGESFSALVPLAVLSGLFVFVAVDGPSVFYGLTMAAILALRVLALPFVAVLHAENQFKIRKALELAAYLLAALLIVLVALAGTDVHLALIALNVSFLLGFLAMAVVAARYVSIGASLREVSLAQCVRVFRAAIPFTVNNLTGLMAYGGFIWLSSLILPQEEVAKLAILHSFILVNLYQVYDVFLKARQADLADASRLAPYRKLNLLLMLAVPPAFLLAGSQAVAILSGNQVELTTTVAAIYGVFVAFELGNLFAQSVTQVDLRAAHRLKSYSLTRCAMGIAFVAACAFPVAGETRPMALIGLLALGSFLSLLKLQHPTKTVFGIGRQSAENPPAAARALGDER